MRLAGVALAFAGIITVGGAVATTADAYPTDEAAQKLTQIRRLKWQQDINDGRYRGRKIPVGATWPMAAIELRMLEARDYDINPASDKDPALQAGLEAILRKWRWRAYNIAILDITDPNNPRYAGVNETAQQTPGSTAKVLLAGGMFRALADRFGDDLEARRDLLRDVSVAADDWQMPNHHEVPVLTGDLESDPPSYRISIRSVRRGDTFTLWEWMDHALSPSSNASASMLWREATLLHLLGDAYPPDKYDKELFARWDRKTLTRAAFEVIDAPLHGADLAIDDFYIRMFFTRGANKYIRSEASRASPLGMLRWLLRVEQGRMVDEFSSLELKRMLYLTRRRIRYAYSPALNNSAAFFKTGSLYKCKPEAGFTCGAYRGNDVNVLNAMIVVETPPAALPEPVDDPRKTGDLIVKEAGSDNTCEDATPSDGPACWLPPGPEFVYLVTVMSNELKRNAATDHMNLATAIHELVTKRD